VFAQGAPSGAWRKLVELGLGAEFFVGQSPPCPGEVSHYRRVGSLSREACRRHVNWPLNTLSSEGRIWIIGGQYSLQMARFRPNKS
jgi:hypothetical protein